jgi:hypothetical protein
MHEKDSFEYDDIFPNEVSFFPRRLTLDGFATTRLLDLSVTVESNLSNYSEFPHAG